MKILLITALLLSSQVFAQTVLSTKIVTLPVKIEAENLKLSRAGYSMPVLKIFVPELAQVTFLNHRNIGASAPCMSMELSAKLGWKKQLLEVSEIFYSPILDTQKCLTVISTIANKELGRVTPDPLSIK